MSDPVGERLRSYYQSIQTDAPAHLEDRVSRALDLAATVPPAPAWTRWRPAFGLMGVAAAAVVVAALVFRGLGPTPAPSPSSLAGPSESPSIPAGPDVSGSPEQSGSPQLGGSPGPSGSPQLATSTSPPTPKLTSGESPRPTPHATPTATASDFPQATPLQGYGTVVAVGAMSPPLSGPAVNLQNATVLIAGGMTVRSDGIRIKTNLAELYKMGSHTFEPTGSMAEARYGHSATVLDFGRVLVVGGADLLDGIGNLATAEIYDPLTGRFTRTGSMAQGRADHTATRLLDGRVLIAGGFGGGTLPLNSAEIYDPATGRFTATGAMTVARQNHTATLLEGGQVLITGGLDANSNVLASAELYDPASGTFRATGSMTTSREWQTATLLYNGKVLIAGGVGADGTTPLASAELYDPATGKFTATGSMATARYDHTATALIYGQVVVAGGQGTNSLEVYWPAQGTFAYEQSLLGPASAAATMADRVLLTGDTPQMYCAWPPSFSPCG